jgi:hypothetical protein
MKIGMKVLSLVAAAGMVILLTLPAMAMGDNETDIGNTGATNFAPGGAVSKVDDRPLPGQTGVVIQDIFILDPGAAAAPGDTIGDHMDTWVDTVTVKKVAGSLKPSYITRLRLYRESGDAEGFDPNKDILLAEVANPDLEAGVTFGRPGSLLFRVLEGVVNKKAPAPADPGARLYVVADFAENAQPDEWLVIQFTATAADYLAGGRETSQFETAPEVSPPVISKIITMSDGTTGDDEADVIDLTPARTVNPGDVAVIQQFKIADPGSLGDVNNDQNSTLIKSIEVRSAPGYPLGPCVTEQPMKPCKITRLRLYRESPLTPPGWQEADHLLGEVLNPNLDGGVIFDNQGRVLVRIQDPDPVNEDRGTEELFYIVADFAPTGFNDGDTIRTQVKVVASDEVEPDGTTISPSSGIETPQPVLAKNLITVEVPPPTIFIGEEKLIPLEKEEGKIQICVRFLPQPGLGELQVGPQSALVYDPEIIEIKSVKGLGSYIVTSFDDSEPGILFFTVGLKPGRKPIEQGCIVEIGIKMTADAIPGEYEIRIEDEFGIAEVDVFRDADRNDFLPPDIVPGKVKIGVLKGDVDGDLRVTATDAKLLAQYILGLKEFDEINPYVDEETFFEIADVCPPFHWVIDVTDVRCIAQAAAGLRKLVNDPEGKGLPARAGSSSTGSFFSKLLGAISRFFGPGRSTSLAEVRATSDTLTVAIDVSSSAGLADIQGTLSFDPAILRVRRISALNGYTILAERIDNLAGQVRFVAVMITGEAVKRGPILEFEVESTGTIGPSSLALSFDLLRDAAGNDISSIVKYELTSAGQALIVRAISAYWAGDRLGFAVQGAGIAKVEVRVFNLAGAKLFDRAAAGSTLEFKLLNERSQPLANGVYLYTVTVTGLNGEVVESGVRKLVILR